MTVNYTSLWQSTAGQFAQSASPGSGKTCRCSTQCRCPPGGPCRCRERCVCTQTTSSPTTSVADMWNEAGNGEIRGSRSYRRGYASRGNAPYRQRWLQTRAGGLYQRQIFRRAQLTRRGRLNGYFAGRFGWGGQVGRICGVLGCRVSAPNSPHFMYALSRWQRLNGLPATGVLTPGLWQLLRRWWQRSGGAPSMGYAAPYTMPPPMEPALPPYTGAFDAGMAAAGAPEDTLAPAPGVVAVPPPEGEPPPPSEAVPGEGEYSMGFGARRYPRRSPSYGMPRPQCRSW